MRTPVRTRPASSPARVGLFIAALLAAPGSMVFSSLVACTSGATEPEVSAAEPSTEERIQALKLELGAAHRAWSEGRRDEAQGLVRSAYSQHFEPMEPALRAQDPVRTLELEYAFGRLEQTFGKPGNPVVVIEDVRALNRDIEAAVSSLPVAEAPE